MKVTRLGYPRPVMSLASVLSGGSSGQAPVANGSNGVEWQEVVQRISANGSNYALGPFVNFASGSNVILAVSSNTINIAATGGSGSLIVKDEGTPLATDATSLDFTGAGVTASGAGAAKTINIPGGGSITLPPIVQTKFAGTAAGSITLDSTPTSGNSILLVLDGFNTGQATAVSSTGATWTQIQTFNNAGGQKAALWVGVVGGSPGAVITVTHPNAFMSMRAMEITDALTPTLGANGTAEVSASVVLTGVTVGSLIVISGGADNTTFRNVLSPTAMIPVGIGADIVPLMVGYALASRIDVSMAPNAGALIVCEVT